MSFVIEPSVTAYYPKQIVDSSLLPQKYITHGKESSIFFKTVNPWYQPGSTENQALLQTYGITSNQQYRKYMTSHSESVKQYNNKSFVTTIK